jgi:hypothetical protein
VRGAVLEAVLDTQLVIRGLVRRRRSAAVELFDLALEGVRVRAVTSPLLLGECESVLSVEWFVRNTPARLHVLRLFLKPEEVSTMCLSHGLGVLELRGMRPKLGWPFWHMR